MKVQFLAVLMGSVLLVGCQGTSSGTATTPPPAPSPSAEGGGGKAPKGMTPKLGPGAANADSHVGTKGGGGN